MDKLYGAALLETFTMFPSTFAKENFSQMLFELTSQVRNLINRVETLKMMTVHENTPDIIPLVY